MRKHTLVLLILVEVSLGFKEYSAVLCGVLHKSVLDFLRLGVVFHKVFLVQGRRHIFHSIADPHVLFFSLQHSGLQEGSDVAVGRFSSLLRCRVSQGSFN